YRDILFRLVTILVLFFFFSSRRRHTRLQGDWSSDVCSSDPSGIDISCSVEKRSSIDARTHEPVDAAALGANVLMYGLQRKLGRQIGRASGRGRGEVWGVEGELEEKEIVM